MKTGTLDFLRMLVEGAPQQAAMGLKLIGVEEGHATLALPYREDLVGFPETGVIAGGAIYTLMDAASGVAVFLALARFQPIATLDLRIDYLKPATPGKTIHGRAQCYKVTRHVAFVRGLAYHDDADTPIAHVSGTFIIGDKGRKDAA
ncbi:MAG: PaaI family thioesterase [Pseudomonadota bacterium]|jgi:uncharacterized protein (TIGR00369 family)